MSQYLAYQQLYLQPALAQGALYPGKYTCKLSTY
jgi:hypothetical protein